MKTIITFALACIFAVALQAQTPELQEGTWSGSLVRIGGNNPRPQGQKIAIEVKKVTDPHWAWRPGGGEVWSVTYVGAQNQGRSQVTNLRLESGSLSFSHMRQDIEMTCRLQRQPDGTYQGECVGEGDPRRFAMTLLPPKASK